MSQQEVYHIIIDEHLDSSWSSWFGNLTIEQTKDGKTILSGPLADQAALHGVLTKIRDLGLTLLLLERQT